ncbi:hypothetical protein OOK13_39130 [Streptomyces sp. NBC_00378]|uniref:hypothetical protein n=1 Tax=unclassified Streptomyces TaxID=2593676 RepID=UPI002252D00F|nr:MULTISPECIES: hypothetical protein [unclassified Streptomyces]MCX5114373.1 hypothetical protein [Streptomyces sp. NBC_00378]
MNVDDIVRHRIAEERRKDEQKKRRRAELAERRRYGLQARHAAKMRRWDKGVS